MCKYCKYVTSTVGGELFGTGEIANIQNGSNVVMMSIFRYINNKSHKHEADLCMHWGVEEPTGDITLVDEKLVAIKYCPFCGEKL